MLIFQMNSCNKFVLFVFVIVEDVHDNGIHNFLQFLPPIGRKNSQILKVAVSNTSNWILDLIRCLYTPEYYKVTLCNQI